MLLTHCVMGWTVVAVLGLCLPVWSAVEVIQPYRVVSTGGMAQVQCLIQPPPSSNRSPVYPYPDPEVVHVTLLRGLHGKQQLCSSTLNLKENRQTVMEKEGEVQCSTEVTEGAMEVKVSGLKAEDTDLYRCELVVVFPPPYLRLTGNGTLIHILGSSDCSEQEAQRETAFGGEGEADDEEQGEERMAIDGVPVVVLMMLVTFVLILIIYFQIQQCRQGSREIVRSVPGGAHKVDAVAFSCGNFA